MLLAFEGEGEAELAVPITGWFLEHAWLIPLIPAIAFFLIIFFGKKMPRGGSEIGIASMLAALVIAVVGQKVRTILVVGHTDCALASIEPLAFRERLSERRVSRLALGTQPLREWLGLFPDVAQNVRDTVAKLRQTPALPRDVRVLGALMEVQTGELTWLDD